MVDNTIRDLRRKHNEERDKEMASLYSLMLGLAERDCFPNNQLRKYCDPNNTVAGYVFDFANPWYVAEPISTVQDIKLIVDGTMIGQEHLAIIIRGQKIPVKVAKTIYEIWWGVGEVLQILIEDQKFINQNKLKKVNLEIHLDLRTTMYYGIPNNLAQYVLNHEMEVL
jgi:hypothetical protein